MDAGLMDKIAVTDRWKSYFADVGLETFDDFYEYTDATTVDANQKRNVQRLVFERDGGRRIFYMKRFEHPHLKDILGTRRHFGQILSQAAVEWCNAHYLFDHGIETYRPAGMGERTRWGIETHSFLVTEELKAVCLRDFIIANWNTLDRGQQERIITAVAELVRTMHGLDIAFPDLVIWHLFFQPEELPDRCRLSIIDLHRMTQGTRSQRRKARDLSRLFWSMVPEYFDDEHRRLLIDTYFEGCTAAQRRSLQAVITRYEATLNKRHTAHRYYKHTHTKP